MGLKSRVKHAQAARALRPMTVGQWPHVLGKPMVKATDATAGDAFRVHSIEATTLINGPGRLRIGGDVYLNSGTRIECWSSVEIGDHVLVAYGATITDSDMHGIGGQPTRELPVRIGSGSWIGARSFVLPGVTVGRRVLVAACAVVTRDTPDDCIVAGNPAKVVRRLSLPPSLDRVHT